MHTAVQFGAGNIGRGFIGSLLSQSGYRVIFADIDETIIGALARRSSYVVEEVGSEQRQLTVEPVTGIASSAPELPATIAECSLVTTAVGPRVLGAIAPTIAEGIRLRRASGTQTPLNIIACENMVGGSTELKRHVYGHLDEETRSFAERLVGFPDSAVDRIVPPAATTEDPLHVRVEEYSEWIVDRSGFVGEPPPIAGMKLADTLPAYLERKLFTLNTGHATAAYVGALSGHRTVGESIADPAVRGIVRGAMEESGEVLVRRHGFDPGAHAAYIDTIIRRFENPYLTDEVARVGRQPLRKLGPEERFIRPLRGTVEFGTPHGHLVRGVAAALAFRNGADAEARELATRLAEGDLNGVVREVTGLDGSAPHQELVAEIVAAYRQTV